MMLAQTEKTISTRDFRRLTEAIYRHCGIVLDNSKEELVRARIIKQVITGGYPSFAEYIDHVLAHPRDPGFSDLIDSITTNLTSFFRENEHFAYLNREFIPSLIASKKKAHTNRIRVWSAACSSGEEPYSLAITLSEALEGRGAWDVKILATDISHRMLRRAREGAYGRQRVAAVPPSQAGKYFVDEGKGNRHCRVLPLIRDRISFRYLNLMEPWPFTGPFDFIFCRNVMIYFDTKTQEKLVGRFWDSLSSGGLLFTGHSESLMDINHGFRYVRPAIYAKP